MTSISQHELLVDRYVKAKDAVINEGFEAELDWQQELNFSNSQESDFLRETAWVILSSGMREKTIRKKFSMIETAFYGFKSASEITENSNNCRSEAISLFSHPGKIDAIISAAFRIDIEGFDSIKNSLSYYGVKFLQSFDFIGPATSYHLAKNLGLHVSKPDRHLVRVAEASGFESVSDLCEKISLITGDTIPVIDLVIWRFATLHNDYLLWFDTKNILQKSTM